MTAKQALQAKAAKRTAGRAKSGSGTQPAPTATPAKAELRPEWLEADASSAVQAVVAAGEAGPELVYAWQERGNAAAIAALGHRTAAGASGEPLPSAVRKAARRAVNVLKSRGVAIPAPAAEPDRAEAAASATAEPKPEPAVATFVPPDTNGMVFFSISQREAGGRYRVGDVVVRPGLGILHANSGRLAGKQIRKWRARVQERLGAPPVEVPLDWARYRIGRARQDNDKSKQLLPLGLDRCAALFEPAPTEEPAHPLADLLARLDAEQQTDRLASSAKLHAEPEFRSWVPERPAMDELLQKVGAELGADGAGDTERVSTALKAEVLSATDRYFTPERRAELADWMVDSAVSLRQREGDEPALQALAVSKQVREAGLITSPPRDIPFLTAFFDKAVAIMARQGQGRLQVPVPAPQPGSAETPAEGAAEADAEASAPSADED